MPEHTLATIEWTALIWGVAFAFGLALYAGEWILLAIDRKRDQ